MIRKNRATGDTEKGSAIEANPFLIYIIAYEKTMQYFLSGTELHNLILNN